MTRDNHRSFSLILALVAAGAMALADGVGSGLTLLAGCALGLTLIWFAEGLASFVGQVGYRRIARPSPPGLVRFFGWAFLVTLTAIAFYGAFGAGRTAS